MTQLKNLNTEPFTQDARKNFLEKMFESSGNDPNKVPFNEYLYSWGLDKKLDVSFLESVTKISNGVINENKDIVEIFLKDRKHDILTDEMSCSSYNSHFEDFLTSKIVELNNLNLDTIREIFEMNLSTNADYLVYMSIIGKTCFCLSPLIALSCIHHFSESIDELKNLKSKVLEKIEKVKIDEYNRLNYTEKTELFVANHKFTITTISFLSLLGIGISWMHIKPKPLTLFDLGKNYLNIIASKSGELLGSAIASFYKSLRKELNDTIIKDALKIIGDIREKIR